MLSVIIISFLCVLLKHPRVGNKAADKDLTGGGVSSPGWEPHAKGLPQPRAALMLPARQLCTGPCAQAGFPLQRDAVTAALSVQMRCMCPRGEEKGYSHPLPHVGRAAVTTRACLSISHVRTSAGSHPFQSTTLMWRMEECVLP